MLMHDFNLNHIIRNLKTVKNLRDYVIQLFHFTWENENTAHFRKFHNLYLNKLLAILIQFEVSAHIFKM